MMMLVLLLGAECALAELSSGFDRVSAALEAGQAVRVSLSAEVDTLDDISESSLGTIRRWLKNSALSIDMAKDGWNAAFIWQGEPQARITLKKMKQESLLSLPDQGLTWRADDETLSKLMGKDPVSPWLTLSPQRGMQRLFSALPDICERLEAAPAVQSAGNSFPYVGKSTQKAVYSLSAEDAQSFWDQTLPAVSAAMGLGDILDPFDGLKAEGPGRVTRYMDAQGNDLALQYSGKLSAKGISARKVSLRIGYRKGVGLFIDIKAPALRGRDDLSFRAGYALTRKESSRALEGAVNGSWRAGQEKGSLKGEIALTSDTTDDGEKLTGSLWIDQGKKRVTLAPDLLFTAQGAGGSLLISERQGKKIPLSIRVTFSLAPLPEGIPPISPESAASLASPAELENAEGAISEALMPAFLSLLRESEPQSLQLLVHELGRETLLSMPGAGPIQAMPSHTNSFIVSDEPVKEEDP